MNALFVSAALFLAYMSYKDATHSTLKKLERNWFTFPEQYLNAMLIIATGLFTTSSIISARKTQWKGDDAMTVVGIIVAAFVGFTTTVA